MLFDALEGIQSADKKDINKRLEKINSKISLSTEKSKPRTIPVFWRVAAFFILLFASVFVVTQYLNTNESLPKDILANEIPKSPKTKDATEENLDDTESITPPEIREDVEKQAIESTKKINPPKAQRQTAKAKETIQHKMQQNAAVDFEYRKASNEGSSEVGLEDSSTQKDQMSPSDGSEVSQRQEELEGDVNLTESAIANVFGQVTDFESGEPLIGVNVMVLGTNIGTTTDIEGNYYLAVPFTSPHLQFNFVGYEPKEYSLKGEEEINISLRSSNTLLDEVVVAPYSKRMQHTDDGEVTVEPKMGWPQLKRFIEENIHRYPSPAERTKTYEKSTTSEYSGSVELEFLVTTFGSLQDFKVLNSTCKVCEERAIQLLKQSGRWKTDPPGQEVKSNITIIF